MKFKKKQQFVIIFTENSLSYYCICILAEWHHWS